MTDICKHGHPRTPENTYITKTGKPQCRVCNKNRIRAKSRKAVEQAHKERAQLLNLWAYRTSKFNQYYYGKALAGPR